MKTPTLSINDLVLLKSYSHKPYLANLPYDLHTTDTEKLKERLYACNEGLKEAQEELKQLQNFKSDVESVEQYNDEIKYESKAKLEKIKQQWEIVKNNEYYSEDIEEFVEEYMDEFLKDMENKEGFISQKDSDYHSFLASELDYAIPDYADDESGYPSWGPLHGFERFVEDHDTLERYVREYLNDFNIDGNSNYAKEMKARIDKLPNDWEEKKRTINREIGKAETKVNDYKEHGKKIKEKIERNKDDTVLVELNDGQIVDMNDTVLGDLTVEDIIYDPYDRP